VSFLISSERTCLATKPPIAFGSLAALRAQRGDATETGFGDPGVGGLSLSVATPLVRLDLPSKERPWVRLILIDRGAAAAPLAGQ
jgi:hypothetical protein